MRLGVYGVLLASMIGLPTATYGGEAAMDLTPEELRQLKKDYPKSLWKALIEGVSERRKSQAFISQSPEKVGPKLVEMMSEMKKTKHIIPAFGMSHRKFWKFVGEIEGEQFVIPAEFANSVADDYIDLFFDKPELFSITGFRVAEFVSRFASSPKARHFVIESISGRGREKEVQEHVLNNLYWGPAFRNDPEVFDALSALFIRDSTKLVALADMTKMDLDRARPIIKNIIDKTSDVVTLNKIAGIVSGSNDSALLQHYIAKVERYPAGGGFDHDPAAGIYDEAMARLIDSSTGSELRDVLSFVVRRKSPGRREGEVFAKKLRTSSLEDRRVIARALADLAHGHRVVWRWWTPAFDECIAKETDSEVMVNLESARKILKVEIENLEREQNKGRGNK